MGYGIAVWCWREFVVWDCFRGFVSLLFGLWLLILLCLVLGDFVVCLRLCLVMSLCGR